MQGLKVITAQEMRRIEQLSFDAGESKEAYMERVGEKIAEELKGFGEFVHLLVGKGNKGGDGLTAATHLLESGIKIRAYHLCPLEECSPLCQQMAERFVKNGGELILISSPPLFTEKGCILDALLGTGFHGSVEGLFRQVIDAANASKLPIFAIDIPSGVNGDTGEVLNGAIMAHTTFSLGYPKAGFFLNQGWNFVGRIYPIDFGMKDSFMAKAEPIAHLISLEKAKEALPKISRTRHKYQAGYLLSIGGSSSMSGAIIMASLAALKTGAGIVRLFYPKDAKEAFSSLPYELIKEEWDLVDATRLYEEAQRAKAVIIGPGMGRTEPTEGALLELLSHLTLPVVIDADALYFLSTHKSLPLPEKAVLTPHTKEMERLLGKEATWQNCQEYVDENLCTLVLKGAPTCVFYPKTLPLIIPRGDPGMAKAGSGDVLTGMIGALLAQGLSPYNAACLGVLLHALAGEAAALSYTSYGVLASNLIEKIPHALLKLLNLSIKKDCSK